MIVQSLKERDLLSPGKRALGFAVGQEPLASLFARYGVEVIASDLLESDPRAQQWKDTQQLAAGLEACWKERIVDRETFERLVSFENIDMTAIPQHLTGFDFTWSACALEHLGSIDAGLDFLRQQLRLLKPSGWAVHTTEYNVSSNEDTVEEDDFSVIFRRRDLEKFIDELTQTGHHVEEVDWSLGDEPYDRLVDKTYENEVHLKLELFGHISTSILLLIRKRSS